MVDLVGALRERSRNVSEDSMGRSRSDHAWWKSTFSSHRVEMKLANMMLANMYGSSNGNYDCNEVAEIETRAIVLGRHRARSGACQARFVLPLCYS